jgi:hypothetical protein
VNRVSADDAFSFDDRLKILQQFKMLYIRPLRADEFSDDVLALCSFGQIPRRAFGWLLCILY